MTAHRAHALAFSFLAAAPLSISVLTSPAALAQAGGLLDGFETRVETSADIVMVPGTTDAARNGPYGEIRLALSSGRVLESLNRIGFASELVLRRDSGRAGLAQTVGDCPPAVTGCASTGGAVPVGAFTGFAAAPGISGDNPAIALETAYVYWSGGYGEVRAGFGPGAAALESEAMPGAFWLMRADSTRSDPLGLNLASTANTLSGHAPKITVRSVRLAGFRVAASFTPDGDVCGASYCRPQRQPGLLAAASVRNIAELGASFDHRFASSGVRWTAGIGLAHGQAHGADGVFFNDPWAVSARIVRSQGGWKAGISTLASNDGVSGTGYRAHSASLSYETGDWLFSAEASSARASLADATSRTVMAGVSRYFSPGIILGLGITHTDADLADVSGGARTTLNTARTRVFMEAGLRF